MTRLPIAIALLALLFTGCAKPKPHRPPAPPPLRAEPAARNYPKQLARPGDMWVHGCTVTKEEGNRADCLCRKASTKIDAQDAAKQSLICK